MFIEHRFSPTDSSDGEGVRGGESEGGGDGYSQEDEGIEYSS